MDKIVQFLKGTKIASRVLFVLWLFFAFFGNFAKEGKLQEIIEFTIAFLLPAITNELCKNPIFLGNTSRFFLFMRNTKTVSRILFQLWAFTAVLGISGGLGNFILVAVVMGVFFLLPAIMIEKKKNPIWNKEMIMQSDFVEESHNIVKEPRTKSENGENFKAFLRTHKRRIFGTICLMFALIGAIAYIQNPIDDPNTGNQASGNLSVAIVFGISALLCFLPLKKISSQIKRRLEHNKREQRLGARSTYTKKVNITKEYHATPSINRKQKIDSSRSKTTNGCLGPALTAVIIFVAFVIMISSIISDSENHDNPDNSNTSEQNETTSSIQEEVTPPPIIDLTAFEGESGVSATVDIEKESDSHLIDVNILATNGSQKDIAKLTLYLVKCYNYEGPLQNWQYCDRLKFENIPAGDTQHSRWVLGTTTTGAYEYRVYVAYVLFTDGTEWGTEEVDHASVVTRAEEVDVCYYEDGIVIGTNTIEKKYTVTYSARVVKNSHVGDSWSYGMKYGETTFSSGQQITVLVASDRGPKLTIYAQESDAQKDDFGQKDIVFSDIAIGETETITEQVMVTENEGRYIGFDAYVQFTVSIKRIS